MAEVIWTGPALADLDAIADYIALDKPDAASAVVKRVFEHVGHLQSHPERQPSAGNETLALPADCRAALSGVPPL